MLKLQFNIIRSVKKLLIYETSAADLSTCDKMSELLKQ